MQVILSGKSIDSKEEQPLNVEQYAYLQPIVTQYLVCNKSEIWP